jgi:hypothetical protein
LYNNISSFDSLSHISGIWIYHFSSSSGAINNTVFDLFHYYYNNNIVVNGLDFYIHQIINTKLILYIYPLGLCIFSIFVIEVIFTYIDQVFCSVLFSYANFGQIIVGMVIGIIFLK